MRLYGKVDGAIDKDDRPLFMGGIFSRRFHNEFPIISRGASFQNFSQGSAVDPTIRSEFEDGTVLSRARFTRLPITISGGYNLLTAADKVLLGNLQTSIKIGVMPFFYTNPTDSVEYDVRLTSPMKFQVEPRNFDYWSVRLEMAQV